MWDWLLALSDEFEIVRRGERRLVHGVYLISRYVIPSIGSTSYDATDIILAASLR